MSNRKVTALNSRKDIVAIGILIFLAFFMPTSIQGRQIEAEWGLLNAITTGLIVVMFASSYGLNKPPLFLMAVLLVQLVVASLVVLVHDAGKFSLARFAPTLVILVVLCLKLKEVKISDKVVSAIVDFLSVVIVAWNICAYLQIDDLLTFIRNFYIQLDDYTATEYSLQVGKPIFTFGVHNFASTFYLFLFYLCVKLYLLEKKKRMLFYAIAYLTFTLLLKSTAAYGTAVFMIALVAVELWYRKRSSGKWIIVLTAPILMVLILMNPAVIDRFLLADNGFIARYATNSLYAENSVFLQSFPFGAGVTIPDGLYFADSGFWIYLTMGNIPFLVGLFALFIMYINFNLTEIDDKVFLACSVFLAELSFASFMYWKTIILLMLSVILLNALSRKRANRQ